MWFVRMELYLRKEEVFDAIARSAMDNAKGSGLDTAAFLEGKKNTTALYWIMTCLGAADQTWFKFERSAFEVWSKLKSKYAAWTTGSTRERFRLFANWKLGTDQSIDDGWTEIQTNSLELAERDSSMATIMTERRIFEQFLAGLPEEYHAVRDGIDAKGVVNVLTDLDLIREKELQIKGRDETAMAARNRGKKQTKKKVRKSFQSRRSNRSVSSSSSLSLSSPLASENEELRFKCFLCGEKGHRQKNCDLLEILKKLKKKEKQSKP